MLLAPGFAISLVYYVKLAGESGLIDFQSHTLYHHRVPVSRKIVDYINPQTAHALCDLPVALGQEGRLCAEGIDGLLGAPVYESDSLMAGRSIHRPDPRLAPACIDDVRRMGEQAFFRSPGWRRDLARPTADWRERHVDQGGFDKASTVARELSTDLRRCRALIEQRLPGRGRRTLAGTMARKIARRVLAKPAYSARHADLTT